ncbi:uncharacterized protein LOC660898 [Tribolium castaneum]|uniref:uncharacterized protein LOC660898 n=1 Tax=Tribolium castaneum TaxID=7070 RepID=UPI0030FE5058
MFFVTLCFILRQIKMGKKLSRPRGSEQSTYSHIFYTGSIETIPPSITYPSICTSPSFHLSEKPSVSKCDSELIHYGELQSMYIKSQTFTADHLAPLTIRTSQLVLSLLKRHLGQIVSDIHAGTLKMPDKVVEKFGAASARNPNQQTDTYTIQRRMITHFVSLLHVHEMVLTYLKQRRIEQALDLIKQIAVSHALKGITVTEFRLVDWFIVNYLIKNKVSTDENINHLMLYLSTLSNYIVRYFESQSVRHTMLRDMTSVKVNDRSNKARENYRLMKQWTSRIEHSRGQIKDLIDKLLADQARMQEAREAEIRSIDTQTLKEKDFIMRFFVRKKPTESRSTSHSHQEKASTIDGEVKSLPLPFSLPTQNESNPSNRTDF